MTVALSPVQPLTALTTDATQLGAVTGEVFAITSHTSGLSRNFAASAVFSADPGATVIRMMISIDGVVWAQVGSDITNAVPYRATVGVGRFLRVDQVSKTNAVVATVTLLQL